MHLAMLEKASEQKKHQLSFTISLIVLFGIRHSDTKKHMLSLSGPVLSRGFTVVFQKRISPFPSWGRRALCLNQTSPLFRLADSSVTKSDFHVRHCRCIICDLLCCEITTVQLVLGEERADRPLRGLKSRPRRIPVK